MLRTMCCGALQSPEDGIKGALLTEAGVAAGRAEDFDSEEQWHQAVNDAMEAEGEPQEPAQERNEPVAAAV